MDTNVFIAGLKPDDPYHEESNTIANSLKKGKVQAETSTITMLEVASVASRLYHAKMGSNQKEHKIFVIKTPKQLTEKGIKFIHITGDTYMTLGSFQTNMPSIINESILLSLQTTLRTLDLMHIAAARHAKRVMNHELGAFVTGDAELLSKKEQLDRIIGMPLLSPREYAKGL